jgi:hypothetical protein
MYRSCRYFKLVYLLLPALVACSNSADQGNLSAALPGPSDSSNPGVGSVKTQPCIEGKVSPASNCLVEQKDSYTYSTIFNGRTVLGANISDSTTRSVTIPGGFYKDKQLEIVDLNNLVSANIKKGVTLFGVVGDFDSTNTSVEPCGTLTDGTKISKMCNLTTSSLYVYQSLFGGRGNSCTITPSSTLGDSITGKCWLNQASVKYLSEQRINYPSCTLGTQTQAECKIPASTYVYPEAYGGRLKICELDKINLEKCWIDRANMRTYAIKYCKEVDGGLNQATCFPSAVGNWVYSTAYGGRDTNCTNDINGTCYFDQATKDKTDPNLAGPNIKAGERIFGTLGTFITAGFYWGSGAHRNPDGTNKRMVYSLPVLNEPANPPYSKIEGRLLASESLPGHYRAVPQLTDTEGSNTDIKVNRVKADGSTPWGMTECGTANGSLATRMANCLSVLGSNATWDGDLKGNAGQGKWFLVTRKNIDSNMYEVWQDSSTELLWSSRVSSAAGLNWCKSAGNSNSQKIDENYREDDPNNVCDNQEYQSNGNYHPISACIEGFGGYISDDASSTNGFMSTGTNQAGKAGLSTLSAAQKANGRVFWRLPTTYDYMLANHNGLRFVLPDATSGEEWTATSFSGDISQAWTFNIKNGFREFRSKNSTLQVRCIGR